MSDGLHSIRRKLNVVERNNFDTRAELERLAVPVVREGEQTAPLEVLDALMTEVRRRQMGGEWPDRAASDRWMAPRVHSALRLYRAEAADRGVWQWIAMRYPWYLQWRWSDDEGVVANNRWWGPIHKQAFARLWWGAEIFRDGCDYGPVERAFRFQDLPNSYLHRPLVRCRSLALAIVDRFGHSATATAAQVNALARVLNLTTVGSPPEVETGYQNDDSSAHDDWVRAGPTLPARWDDQPQGPSAVDTSPGSRASGATVVHRGWTYAKLG